MFDDRAAMGAAAAADVSAFLRKRIAERGTARMVFAAAPSQAELCAGLVAAEGIAWEKTTLFHMDEFIGLASDAPQRFAHWLDAHLFAHLPGATVQRITPEPHPEKEARRYAALLNEAPLDGVCLGIGVNGHIAFNDPPVADFADKADVKIVEMDEICRRQQVDDGAFPTLGDVPRRALTLTVPRLLRAERLFCVVPGAQKAAAARDALLGPISETCPASALRRHPACALYLDQEAARHV